jgi:hypothetical protein
MRLLSIHKAPLPKDPRQLPPAGKSATARARNGRNGKHRSAAQTAK